MISCSKYSKPASKLDTKTHTLYELNNFYFNKLFAISQIGMTIIPLLITLELDFFTSI